MIEILIWPIALVILVMFFLVLFRKSITEFIQEVGRLKTKWFEVERIRKELFAKTEELEAIVKEVKMDKSNLKEATKILVETIYLTIETKGYFPIPVHIRDTIQRNLNALSTFSVEQEHDRQKWIDDVNQLLSRTK